MSHVASRLGVVVIVALPVVACTAGHGSTTGALEPRFVAVHNTLSAMGFAMTGPIFQGALGEGKETRISLDLAPGCTTLVTIGGEGVRDVDAQLLDPAGQPVAHDTTAEPQAVLKVCTDVGGPYVLSVKAASGSGGWVATAWQGGTSSPVQAVSPQSGARQALGTCEAPIPLSVGTVTGSTARGEDGNSGSCERSDARELVYELDVTQRERVVLDVEAHFDSMLYIRKDACGDADAEVDCNDDAPSSGRNHSRIERVLEPGRYFVFVDGYNQESGNFKLTVSTADVLSLSDVCGRALSLNVGTTVSATSHGRSDDAQASCGGGAEGSDVPWHFDLPSRARVRLVEHADDMSPVVHVRRACADEASEIACGEAAVGASDAVVAGILDPGRYTAFADARDRDAAGGYSLLLESDSPDGTGAPGDGCGDAISLVASTAGDTFTARDDVEGSCGGAGAADVVYRLDVPRRSRFVARLESEERPHLLTVGRRCGDKASELACGNAVDEVLAAGTYFVAVDGASPDAFGRFRLTYALQDLSAQAAACDHAPTLVDGRALSSTSAGMGDRFASSCAGGGDFTATGADRVFRFVLPTRAAVRLTLVASGFDATLAIRRACSDGAGGGAELTCEADSSGSRQTTVERTLEAGTYYAVVDGQSATDQGAFSLEYRSTSNR